MDQRSVTVSKKIFLPLIVMIALSLAVKEFYPLSAFPMYSNLNNGAHYFYLETTDEKPIALKPTFGISGSDLKKKYHAYLDEIGEEKGIKDAYTLGKEEQWEAGQRLLSMLEERAKKKESSNPYDLSQIRLIRSHIKTEKGKIKQDKIVVYVSNHSLN